MQIAIADEVPFEERKDPTREGLIRRKWLLTGGMPDGLNFRLFRSQYQEGENAFQSPRHHHGFQQIRWAESGTINYGPDQNIPEGDIAYFPRGTYYGPQLKDKGVSWLLQFGFGHELAGGQNSVEVNRQGVEQLRERGKIDDDGMFVDVDPETGQERRRNPAEVIVEERTGQRYAIPAEGYETPILMHPQAFEYYAASPGVEIRNLGSFYDHSGPDADVRISMIRLTGKGTIKLDARRAQLAWTAAAGLRIGDRDLPELTAVFSPCDEELFLACDGQVEIYMVEFPLLPVGASGNSSSQEKALEPA